MYQVTPDEAKEHLDDLIKAALTGEMVFIAQDAEHTVQLVPITHTTHDRVAGSGKGRIMRVVVETTAPQTLVLLARRRSVALEGTEDENRSKQVCFNIPTLSAELTATGRLRGANSYRE